MLVKKIKKTSPVFIVVGICILILYAATRVIMIGITPVNSWDIIIPFLGVVCFLIKK